MCARHDRTDFFNASQGGGDEMMTVIIKNEEKGVESGTNKNQGKLIFISFSFFVYKTRIVTYSFDSFDLCVVCDVYLPKKVSHL